MRWLTSVIWHALDDSWTLFVVCIRDSRTILRVAASFDKNKRLAQQARLIRAEARIAQLPIGLSEAERKKFRRKIRNEEARRDLRVRHVLITILLVNLVIASFGALAPFVAKKAVDLAVAHNVSMEFIIHQVIIAMIMFYTVPNLFEAFRNFFLMKYYRNRFLELIDTLCIIRHLDKRCRTVPDASHQAVLSQGRDDFILYVELLLRDTLFALTGMGVLFYLFWLSWRVATIVLARIVFEIFVTSLMVSVLGGKCDERKNVERSYLGEITSMLSDQTPETKTAARDMRTVFGFMQYGYLSLRESIQFEQTAFEQGIRTTGTHIFIALTMVEVAWSVKNNMITIGDAVAMLPWIDKATDPMRVFYNIQAEYMRIKQSLMLLRNITGLPLDLQNGNGNGH